MSNLQHPPSLSHSIITPFEALSVGPSSPCFLLQSATAKQYFVGTSQSIRQVKRVLDESQFCQNWPAFCQPSTGQGQYQYGHLRNYCTGTIIETINISTGMVLQEITALVLSFSRSASVLVWSPPIFSLPVLLSCYANNVMKKLHYQYCTSHFSSNTGNKYLPIW